MKRETDLSAIKSGAKLRYMYKNISQTEYDSHVKKLTSHHLLICLHWHNRQMY